MSDQAKCECGHCQQHVAFPVEDAGQTVACPGCGRDLLLFIPSPPRSQSVGTPMQLTPAVRVPEPVVKIEDTLTGIGTALFYGGMFVAVGAMLLMMAFFVNENLPVAGSMILTALVAGAQGIINRALFHGFAELIRLQRKKVTGGG